MIRWSSGRPGEYFKREYLTQTLAKLNYNLKLNAPVRVSSELINAYRMRAAIEPKFGDLRSLFTPKEVNFHQPHSSSAPVLISNRTSSCSSNSHDKPPHKKWYSHLVIFDEDLTSSVWLRAADCAFSLPFTMQIDPAALSRTDSASTAVSTSKAVASAAAISQKSTKALISVPRLDLEPVYTELKAAIGDNWAEYKQSTTLFLLGIFLSTQVSDIGYLLITFHQIIAGHLNQDEFSSRLDPIICADPRTEHLHNNFVCALIGNLSRDLPDHGVASWVSANDKPTVVSKPVSSDLAEQRLKTEVMQLPPRDRKRIKAIPEVGVFALEVYEGKNCADMF